MNETQQARSVVSTFVCVGTHNHRVGDGLIRHEIVRARPHRWSPPPASLSAERLAVMFGEEEDVAPAIQLRLFENVQHLSPPGDQIIERVFNEVSHAILPLIYAVHLNGRDLCEIVISNDVFDLIIVEQS